MYLDLEEHYKYDVLLVSAAVWALLEDLLHRGGGGGQRVGPLQTLQPHLVPPEHQPQPSPHLTPGLTCVPAARGCCRPRCSSCRAGTGAAPPSGPPPARPAGAPRSRASPGTLRTVCAESRKDFTITVLVTSATSAFTFKTLLRHYAKLTLTHGK